jgi:hypothetical protein
MPKYETANEQRIFDATVGPCAGSQAARVVESFKRDGLTVVALEQRSVVQAIHTRFLSPRNVRGARVKATAQAGSVTLSWDHRHNPERNHRMAAEALAKKFGWTHALMVQGGMPNGDYVFTLHCGD